MKNYVQYFLILVIFASVILFIYSYYLIGPINQPGNQEKSNSKQFGCNSYVSSGNSSRVKLIEELESRREEVYSRCPQDLQYLSQPVHSMWVQDLKLDLLICAPYKSASSAIRFWWWRHYHSEQDPHDFWNKDEDHDWGMTRNALLKRLFYNYEPDFQVFLGFKTEKYPKSC